MVLWLRKLLLGLFLTFSGLSYSFSQTYGNEWLDWTQFHGKIKIWKDNVYRLGYFSIEPWFTARGLYLNTISTDDFAMYNMGRQVPIHIYDQNANKRFDAFDYIEFVDGLLRLLLLKKREPLMPVTFLISMHLGEEIPWP